MKILGIHDGHDASACLMINGKVISANQEERFSKLKGDYGLPLNAIKSCLKSGANGVCLFNDEYLKEEHIKIIKSF